jgi:hypothetical protein
MGPFAEACWSCLFLNQRGIRKKQNRQPYHVMYPLILFLACIPAWSVAQELFVYTEPASNMPAKSMGIRLTNHFMDEPHVAAASYHLMPELMVGISKNLMIHGTAFLNNSGKVFGARGGEFYIKYRFLSHDDIHNHFRVAGFAKYVISTSVIHKPSIDFDGHNSGYETGLVATKLISRFAVSASTSFLHATDNGSKKFVYGTANRNALDYSLSAGLLIFPKEYTSYNQVNLNLMIEFLGQKVPHSGYGFMDMAPSLQLIINSRARIDGGYRFNITNNIPILPGKGFLVRFEYNFYNIFK